MQVHVATYKNIYIYLFNRRWLHAEVTCMTFSRTRHKYNEDCNFIWKWRIPTCALAISNTYIILSLNRSFEHQCHMIKGSVYISSVCHALVITWWSSQRSGIKPQISVNTCNWCNYLSEESEVKTDLQYNHMEMVWHGDHIQCMYTYMYVNTYRV